jgi:hypothetical protein
MRRRTLRSFGIPNVAPWLPVAMSLWEMSVTAPQVIALRSARMLNAGAFPSARDQREFLRMFEEKAEALADSITAMSLQLFAMNQSIAASFFRMPWNPPVSPWAALRTARGRKSFSRLVAKGVAPIHRRVTANAVRLGRART